MKKHLIRECAVLPALALIIGLLGLVAPQTASAEALPKSCKGVDVTKGTDYCQDITASKPVTAIKPTVTTTITHVNGVSVKANVTVLKNVQAKGSTKSQLKKNKTYKLPKGKKLWTSYKDARTNETKWHNKYYRKGHKFYMGKDGYFHDKPCHNKVVGLPKKKKGKNKIIGKKVYGAVKIVREATFTGVSTARVSDYVTSFSKAWAHAYNSAGVEICKAYGEGSASASFAASATARISGKVYTSISAAVSGLARGAGASLKAKLQGRTYYDIRASLSTTASGSATAKSKALAWVKCDNPPPTNQPPAGDIVGPQHLYVGGTATYRAYGWDPEDGSNVTLDISVSGAATGGTTVEDYVTDGKKAKKFLITAGSSTGTATITLKVTDSKGAVFTKTASFPVVANDTGDNSGG